MSERSSRVLPALLGCGFIVVASGVLCCCGSCGVSVLAPNVALRYLAGTVTSSTPLPIPETPADPDAAGVLLEICEPSRAGEPKTFTTDQLNRAFHTGTSGLWLLRDGATEPEVLASVELEPGQYLNVQSSFQFTLEHGWFRSLTLQHLEVGSWDLSPYLGGEDFSGNGNDGLTDARRDDPQVDAFLDALTRLSVEGTTWSVQLDPNSELFGELCGASGPE